MKRTLEHKIRFNVIIIYVIVALIFAGTIVYIHHLRKDIDEQKESARLYYNELTLANSFVERVNQVQWEANHYVSTGKAGHYKKFKECLSDVENLVDSLNTFTDDSLRYQILYEVKNLLKKKGDIVLRLSREFNRSDYLDEIDEMKSYYEESVKNDSVWIATTVKDTIISVVAAKGFWRRLSNVFSTKSDTMLTERLMHIDTMRVPKADTVRAIGEMNDFTEQIGESYSNRIAGIAKQVKQLHNADHELSTKISYSVMVFYNQVIYKRLEEIHKSDELVSKNSIFSLVGGGLALGLALVFIIWIINDVNRSFSNRKRLETANMRIKKMMQSRHQLLLSVSHDVKTPLNSILANIELNRNTGTFSKEDIRSMDNAGKHILSLLENLLHFSSLEQGALQKELRVFALINFCREIKDMFSPLFLAKKLKFTCEFNFGRELVLCADELRMKQIVINLLSNAAKYTLEGTVLFRVEYDANGLILSFSDTGVGIPEQQIGKLFMPFSRVEQNNEVADGTGFGLYVVKGLVDLLEGTITVDSAVDKGTTLAVRLPVVEAAPSDTDFSAKRIVVFDDDLPFLQLLSRMLIRLGHSPVVAGGISEQALKCLDAYDLVLTDMEMGSLSGTDVLARIREQTVHLPVVVMTAQADYSEAKAREAGFTAYLKKPVSLYSLRQLLGGREEELDLQNLYEMFDDDTQAVGEILRIFMSSTKENIDLLQQAVDAGSFTKASDLCHKMLPMFLQIGETKASEVLKKMEINRSHRYPPHEGWQEEIAALICMSRELLTKIEESLDSR